jgi:bacillolysin
MKRFALLCFAFSLVIGTLFLPNQGFAKDKNPSVDKKAAQMKILERFQQNSKEKENPLKVSWDKKKGIPNFVSGFLSSKPVKTKAEVLAFLQQNRDLFNLGAGDFKVQKVEKDRLGMTHYRTQLTVDGIPVYGAEWLVHTNKDGNVIAMNGHLDPQLGNVDWQKSINLSADKAIKTAEKALNFTPKENTFTTEPTAKLYLYQKDGKWLPAYQVELTFLEPYPGRMFYFVNADNGEIVDSYNALESATGTGVGVLGDTKSLNTTQSNGTYYLIDQTKPMSGTITTYTANNGTTLPGPNVTDADDNFNSSSEAPAVDAHYYAGVVYDYYYNTFGRNSYDNNGSTIKSSVHYSTNYNNAFWNGTQMVYGDGDGSTFIPLSGALDVIGHELTHAVTESTANLTYQDQPGALNESMSDVFGMLIEAAHGDTDWDMGEDVYTPGVAGDALRSLSDPTLYNQPDNMANYVYTTSDNGGVHTNSGIPNKAFYNIATTIGLSKSQNIYYRALTQYLTSQSNFTDARNALLQAATDLYGTGSAEYNAVADGYAAVGIGSPSGGGGTTDTYEPNDSMSSAYGPITSGTTYNSYIASSSDVDYYKFNTAQSGTISVSLSNLPGDYDLYLYNSGGTLLAQSTNGSTSSESISYSASSSGTFYVKVVGYNGASNTSQAYALSATYPTGSSTTAQWYYESASADTPHPYPNNYDSGHTYSKPGAQKVAIHFSQFETEANYDYVNILDKNNNITAQYTGTQSAFWAIVDGDTISTELVSDYSVTAYGYHIDEVAYYNDTPLLTTQGLTTNKEKGFTNINSEKTASQFFKDPIN